MASRGMSVVSYIARLTRPSFTGCLSYARGTTQLHYYRKLSDRVSLGGELVTTWAARESTVSLAGRPACPPISTHEGLTDTSENTCCG